MLKVVGASWLKTRISSYIIIGSLLLAVGSLFLAEMERPTYNGTYCATVYWTNLTGFTVDYWGQQNDLKAIPKGVARTCYKDSRLQNGWAQIEIETQPHFPDWVQAFGAGLLEGALTWHSIYYQWKNTIKSYCEEDEHSEKFCQWLRETITKNSHPIRQAKKRGIHDSYWHQIKLFNTQMEGLEYGWRNGVKRSRAEYELDSSEFLLLNAMSDIPDLRIYYENFIRTDAKKYEYLSEPVKGSMLIRFLRNQNEQIPNKFLMGHSSDGSYSSMLRVLKKYKFHFHYSASHKKHEVEGVDIAFTGYPGTLASSDDFYIINGKKSKLIVGGIRLQNNNIDLWRNVNINNTILLAGRVMAANRLSHSGRSWSKIMAKNPGFGTKQWVVVDVKRFRNKIVLPPLQQPLSSSTITDNIINTSTTTDSSIITTTQKTTTAQTINTESSTTITTAGTKPINIGSINKNSMINDSNDLITASGLSAFDDNVFNIGNAVVDDFVNVPQITTKTLDGSLWIIDQLPGRLHAEDQTQEIVYDNGGIWTANGIPYFKAMREISHIEYDIESVQKTMQQKSNNITDLDSVAKVLKSRAYRGDLMGENASAFGNIDIKLYSETSRAKMEFRALAGPLFYNQMINNKPSKTETSVSKVSSSAQSTTTYELMDKSSTSSRPLQQPSENSEESLVNDSQLSEIDMLSERRLVRDDIRAAALLKLNRPFKWSTTKLNDEHNGQPDVWNFHHVSPTWAWQHDNNPQ